MKQDVFMKKIKQLGKKNLLILLGLLGIVLIGLSSLWQPSDVKQTAATTSGEDMNEYTVQLEEQLEGMISSIQGVGQCDVMVTLEQGTEYIYAVQEKSTQDSSQTNEENRVTAGERVSDEETYIMVSTDTGQQPLLITSLTPKVKGVVVVCNGGGDAGVATRVRGAIATALDISTERIYVTMGTIS